MSVFDEHERLMAFLQETWNSNDYLKMPQLLDRHSYKIVAGGAYVGVWIKEKEGFLTSCYGPRPAPFLFLEYHCDIEAESDLHPGTVRPVSLIEKCPHFIASHDLVEGSESISLLHYLDQLEAANPIVPGVDTLCLRKLGLVRWIYKQNKLRELKAIGDSSGFDPAILEKVLNLLMRHVAIEPIEPIQGNELTLHRLETITGETRDVLEKCRDILIHPELRPLLDRFVAEFPER